MAAEEKKSDASESEAAPAPPAGGGSKLGVILGLVQLLVTLGIGAVVFISFQKEKHRESVADIAPEEKPGEAKPAGGEHGEAPKEGEKPAEGAKAEGGHGEHGEGAPPKASSHVITLDQFTVNLSTTVGTPPRFARVAIAVEVGSDDAAQELNQKMPQVRNAILDLFNSKRPADLQTGEGRNFLKEEIRNALNSFLVTGKVKGVFFSNFVISN